MPVAVPVEQRLKGPVRDLRRHRVFEPMGLGIARHVSRQAVDGRLRGRQHAEPRAIRKRRRDHPLIGGQHRDIDPLAARLHQQTEHRAAEDDAVRAAIPAVAQQCRHPVIGLGRHRIGNRHVVVDEVGIERIVEQIDRLGFGPKLGERRPHRRERQIDGRNHPDAYGCHRSLMF